MSNHIRVTRFVRFTQKIAAGGLILLATLLLLTSCHRHDMQLTQDIVGTWKSGDTGDLHIYPEGSFRAKLSQPKASPAKTWNFGGVWEIKDGTFVAVITNSFAINWPDFQPSGTTNEYKIVKADKTSLVWELNGETTSWDRR